MVAKMRRRVPYEKRAAVWQLTLRPARRYHAAGHCDARRNARRNYGTALRNLKTALPNRMAALLTRAVAIVPDEGVASGPSRGLKQGG